MTKTTLTKGEWTEITTAVTSFSFNLINVYPDSIKKCGYRIHWGSVEPAVDTVDYNYYELDTNGCVYAFPVSFSNTVAQNIYVMPIFDDGAVTF